MSRWTSDRVELEVCPQSTNPSHGHSIASLIQGGVSTHTLNLVSFGNIIMMIIITVIELNM